VNKLKVRSCLIDGEAVCCNEHGVPSFDKLRHRSNDPYVVLIAFDLLELDGNDLRREPGYRSPDRYRLGTWVSKQRLSRDKLSAER
jgi:ATP-dependent DNA ligase